jgi:Rha family phage regulatory protein
MNKLTVQNYRGQFVVDSREVAEMVDKNHKELLRDIRNYEGILLSANLRSVDFFINETYKDSTGRTLPLYLLTRRGCDMVANKMTGEKGVLFTAAYVTKFEEMERQLSTSQFQIPQTFSEALRLAADLADQNQKMLPKAESFDRFISADNLQNMNVVAKTLGWGRNKLFRELRDRRILLANNTPYQEYIERGYFEVKQKPIRMGESEVDMPQTFVTARGIEYLSKVLLREEF